AGSTLERELAAYTGYDLMTCTSAGLAASPASPQLAGTTVTLTASSVGCSGTPQYRYWLQQLSGTWVVLQDYPASPSYRWNTSGLSAGHYTLAVTVRRAGSTLDREQAAYAGYDVLNCSSAGLTTSPPSPQPVGTTVTLT